MIFLDVMILFMLIYFVGILFAPFPHRKSLSIVWRSVLFDLYGYIPIKTRFHLALFLLRESLLIPIWTVFWYLDEVLYSTYRQTTIDRCVFIAGQPRSGTTFLHRTLCNDKENFVCIRHYEWRYPFLTLLNIFDFLGLTQKIAKHRYWPRNKYGATAAKMHEHYLGDYEEDGIFLEERLFHHYFIYRRFPFPRLLPYVASFDVLSTDERDRILKVYTSVMRKIIYRKKSEGKILVLKENEIFEMLPYLKRKIPQMLIIGLVREPNEFFPSYVQLSRLSTQAKTGIDPIIIPGWFEKNTEHRERQCHLMATFFIKYKHCSKVIAYSDLTKNILGTVGSLYRFLDIEISERYMRYLEHLQHLQVKRKRKYGINKIAYSLNCKKFNILLELANEKEKL